MLGTQGHCSGGAGDTGMLLWRCWGHRDTVLEVLGTRGCCSGGAGGTEEMRRTHKSCLEVLGQGAAGAQWPCVSLRREGMLSS